MKLIVDVFLKSCRIQLLQRHLVDASLMSYYFDTFRGLLVKSQKEKIIIHYFAPGTECLAPLTLDFTEKNQRAKLNLKIGLESLHIRDKNFAGEINQNQIQNSNFDCKIGQNQNWLRNKTKLKNAIFFGNKICNLDQN